MEAGQSGPSEGYLVPYGCKREEHTDVRLEQEQSKKPVVLTQG